MDKNLTQKVVANLGLDKYNPKVSIEDEVLRIDIEAAVEDLAPSTVFFLVDYFNTDEVIDLGEVKIKSCKCFMYLNNLALFKKDLLTNSEINILEIAKNYIKLKGKNNISIFVTIDKNNTKGGTEV